MKKNVKGIAFIMNRGIVNSFFLFMLLFSMTGKTHAQTWAAMGSGMNDWVYASTIFNGDLIVGGKFTSAGGVSANHIARWDGTSWTPMGLGVNGKVNALMVYNGNLVAAGEFTSAGGIEVNFIAQWDGVAWNDELGGVGSTVTSLAVIGDTIYAGGYFVEADNTPVKYIAKRDTSGWVPLGGGMGGVEGQVMALTVQNGELYAGGFFTTAGGIPANHIARWNGSSWSPLGSGISGIVYTLATYNGSLVAGGLFLSAGGNPANHIASWNGSSWSPLAGGMGGVFYQYVFALAVYNEKLYAGGYFTTTNGLSTNGIAQWNGSDWSGLNGGFFYPANVYGAHTLCVYNSSLIAGGLFTSAGTVSASHLANWSEPFVPANLSIQNDTVISGFSNCYNATQTITVAGGGTSFVVQNGASATMIAGQAIMYLPGVKVDSGGYMHGYISGNGQYCGYRTPQLLNMTAVDGAVPENNYNSMFTIYPNPSDGVFFVDLNKSLEFVHARLEIFSISGKKVLSADVNRNFRQRFSLIDNPSGIYFIRVISQAGVETKKIVRQ